MGRPKTQGPNKAATTIYIQPAQRRALQRLARRLDVSAGHLIRAGINLVLEQHKQRKENT